MKKITSLAFVLFLVTFSIFASEPKIKEIKLEKTVLKPGETISVSIEFTGKPIDIQSVELFSREFRYDAPKMLMQLIGDGKNIWVLKTDLPYEAPIGTYNVEVQAKNKDGEEIISEDCEGCMYGKTGVFKFEVK